MKIAFVGDISLNGVYCDPVNSEKTPFIFSEIRDLLEKKGVSLIVGNLESPLKTGEGENLLKDPRVHTNGGAIEALKLLSPAVLTVANNHIYDCLAEGVIGTQAWLSENGFDHLGAGTDAEEAKKPYRFSKEGNKITVFSYVAEDTHPSLPDNCGVFLNFLETERVISDIKHENPDTFVIVNLHWGMEFSHYPSALQRELARSFVDAGARLVIGHHSHTLQGFEEWNGGYIFYNLGNFVFSDVFDASNPVLWTKDQLRGGLAIVGIENGKVTDVEMTATHIDGMKVKIEGDQKWQQKLGERNAPLRLSDLEYNRFWKKYYFREFVIKPPFRYFFGERKNFFSQLCSLKPKHFLRLLSYAKEALLRLSGIISRRKGNKCHE